MDDLDASCKQSDNGNPIQRPLELHYVMTGQLVNLFRLRYSQSQSHHFWS